MHPALAATFNKQRWQREANSTDAAGLPCEALRQRERVVRVEHIARAEHISDPKRRVFPMQARRQAPSQRSPVTHFLLVAYLHLFAVFFSPCWPRQAGRQTARRDDSVSCPTIKRRSEEQIGEGKQAAIEEICEKSGSTRVLSEHWVAHRNRYNAAREAQRNHCRLQGKSYSARFGPFSSKRAVTYAPGSPHHSGVITPMSTSLLLYSSVQR